MWSEKSRSWRRKNKRGVSPIIATILLVAITVVLAAVLYILISGFTKGPGNTPLGTAFTFGTASQTSNTAVPTFCAAAVGISDYCEDFPVGSAGGGITAGALNFAIRDSSGNPVSFSHGTPSIQIESTTGTSLASYSFTTSSWTVGGSISLSTTQSIVLDLGCTVSGASACAPPTPGGEVLVALGVGSYSGQVQVTLV